MPKGISFFVKYVFNIELFIIIVLIKKKKNVSEIFNWIFYRYFIWMQYK